MGLNDWPKERTDAYIEGNPDRNEPEWYDYAGFVVAETDKAVGLGTEYPGDVEMWLPKSQLSGIEYDEGGDSDEVRVGEGLRAVRLPQWLAEEKDLA